MSMHMQTGPDGKTWGWYNTKNDEFEPILCWVCDQPFTEQSWEERHTDEETANDVHKHCCVDCNHKSAENAVELILIVLFPEYDDDEPHPMLAFTDDLDYLIEKHFPEFADEAEYFWEHI